MNNLLNDLRYALRQLRRSPGFAVTAVATLAIGLGASSAIFCLMDGLWLHPIPVPHSGQLVRVFSTTAQDQQGPFSYPEFQTMSQRTSAFQGASAGLVAAGGRGSLLARPGGTSTLLLNNVVSSNFFSVLDLHPFMGRVFTPADAETLRVHPGLLLSYRCWQRTFGGDPSIVGRAIPLRRGEKVVNQVDVWGILPPEFRDIDVNSDRDLWIPAESWAALRNASDLTSKQFRWFNLIGRLAPGATATQANEQVAAIAASLETADPADNHDRGARAVTDFRYRMNNAGTTGMVLLAIVGGVVLLATVNVAHLLMARALGRAPEVAMRLSLGATRRSIARQLLIENCVLCVLGWAAGLAFATAIAAILPRLLVSEPAMLVSMGAATRFQIDWRVFVLAGGLALATMLLLALVPLMQAARTELLPSLRQAQASRVTARNSIGRRTAVWLQIGISFALLVSTGALVRSFLNTRTRPIGLTREQVLVAFTQDPDEPLRTTVRDNLRALPGVQKVAYGIRSPLMPSEGGIAVKALFPTHPELRQPVEIKFNAVSPDFLQVTGTRVVRGRGIIDADTANAPVIVLVNQTMAQKYWPGQDPLGQVVHLAEGRVDARVAGVTEDAPINQIGELPESYIHMPFAQYQAHIQNMGELTFVLATRPNAMSMAQDVRQALVRINPLLDPMMVTSQPELIRYSAGNYQMMAELVTVLGLIGLLLTVVGLYGFLAFRVTERKREIGIRIALGATRQATAWLVLRDTLSMATVGLVLGAVLSLAVTRLETSVLFGVRPLDATSIVAALAFLAIAAAVAAWLPARRAASIDPIQALRTE